MYTDLVEKCVHATLLQSRPTFWDPVDYSLPGASVHGILQAWILEWVAMPSSSFSRPGIGPVLPAFAVGFFTQWTTREAFGVLCCCWSVAQSCPTLYNFMDLAHQTPLSMEFSRQESWSGLPFPSPRDLPDPGIKPRSPALLADYLALSHQGSYWN